MKTLEELKQEWDTARDVAWAFEDAVETATRAAEWGTWRAEDAWDVVWDARNAYHKKLKETEDKAAAAWDAAEDSYYEKLKELDDEDT